VEAVARRAKRLRRWIAGVVLGPAIVLCFAVGFAAVRLQWAHAGVAETGFTITVATVFGLVPGLVLANWTSKTILRRRWPVWVELAAAEYGAPAADVREATSWMGGDGVEGGQSVFFAQERQLGGRLPSFAGVHRRLSRMGRIGGVLALGFDAGALCAGGVMIFIFGPWNHSGYWYPGWSFAGLGVVVAGLLGFRSAVAMLLHPRARPPLPTKEAFLAQVRRAPKPLWVCSACRLLVQGEPNAKPTCSSCDSGANTFRVDGDVDVRVLAAAVPE
jgi:hypothetical protein